MMPRNLISPKVSLFVFLAGALSAIHAAVAEVLEAENDTFYLEIVREVTTSPERAYEQFIRVGEWWNARHTWFGDSRNLSIEPVAGGCFCEIDGERSAAHMRVSFVQPGVRMHLLGGLGPLQAMGLQGAMVWSFEPGNNGGTRILHSYRVTGHASAGLRELAAVVDKVQTDQVDRLQAKLSP